MIQAYSAETIQAVEKPYISAPDYNGWLMGKAAEALAQYCSEYLRQSKISSAKIMVLAGKGNNGADALFSGVHLLHQGHAVIAYMPQGTNNSAALFEFQRAGGQLIDQQNMVSLLAITDLVIDGLLGIGASGKPRAEISTAVQTINRAKATHRFHLVACDVPTGLCSDTVTDDESVMHADATVTFIAAKDSLLSAPEHVVGHLKIVPLGIEQDLAQHLPVMSQWEEHDLAQFFPRPKSSDYKYTRGVCGIVAGSSEYPGAALLTTSAAVRTGCGMVKFFGSEPLRFQVTGNIPEAVTSSSSIEGAEVTAWLLGPGAVGEERHSDIVAALASGRPALIDAAALEPAARWVAEHGKLTPAQILTPHTGELVRLLTWLYALAPEKWSAITELGEPSKESVSQNPLAWTKLAAQLTGATVMLKGHNTWIATPDEQVFIYKAKTAWLATAGSGDTLSAIIGGLLAQCTARWEENGYQAQTSDFAQLVALGNHIHNSAALAANQGLLGPVPPSYLAEHIPLAITQMLR